MEFLNLTRRFARVPVKQLIRYGIVGVGSNASIYLLYLGVTRLGMAPRLAMTLSYATGVCVGFIVNRKWTFAFRGALMVTIIRYGIAHSVGYAINFAMLTVFTVHLGFPHQAVQAAAIIVVAVVLFVMFRYFVFWTDQRPSGI